MCECGKGGEEDWAMILNNRSSVHLVCAYVVHLCPQYVSCQWYFWISHRPQRTHTRTDFHTIRTKTPRVLNSLYCSYYALCVDIALPSVIYYRHNVSFVTLYNAKEREGTFERDKVTRKEATAEMHLCDPIRTKCSENTTSRL